MSCSGSAAYRRLVKREAGRGVLSGMASAGADAVQRYLGNRGGASRDRTDDLDNAIVALSQLSYGPTERRVRLAAAGGGVNRAHSGSSVSWIAIANHLARLELDLDPR